MPEKCGCNSRKSRTAGVACHRTGYGASFVEEEHVAVHWRGNGMLYAVGTIHICIKCGGNVDKKSVLCYNDKYQCQEVKYG